MLGTVCIATGAVGAGPLASGIGFVGFLPCLHLKQSPEWLACLTSLVSLFHAAALQSHEA